MQWGAWAAVGMAAASAAALARIQRSGMGVIQPATGLQALQRLLLCGTADDPAQVTAYLALWTANTIDVDRTATSTFDRCSLPSAGHSMLFASEC